MSDLAKVGFSLPSNRRATTPDTQNWPICTVSERTTASAIPRHRVLVRNPCVSVARSCALDGRLTVEARGLMLIVCALPEEVSLDAGSLLRLCPGWEPRDLESALDNLREHGYLYISDDGVPVITDTPGAEWLNEPEPHVPPTPAPPKLKTIYFVEREGLVKIGITGNLKNRIKVLNGGGSMPQGMTVGPVTLLATEPGDEAHERQLHERFASWRVVGTEWFRPSKALRAYIAGLQVPHSGLVDVVE